jgi:uncharacterized protein YndB with AHSA1/START domain
VIVTRSRTVAADPEAVWAVVADPSTLPRWWPRTERVEGVTADAWTVVLRSARGRPVRADWRLDGEDWLRRRAWAQQLDGTPFARVLAERRVEARLERVGAGTGVTLELRQRGRRWARFGGFMMRRAAGRELEGALGGLQRVLTARGHESRVPDHSGGPS